MGDGFKIFTHRVCRTSLWKSCILCQHSAPKPAGYAEVIYRKRDPEGPFGRSHIGDEPNRSQLFPLALVGDCCLLVEDQMQCCLHLGDQLSQVGLNAGDTSNRKSLWRNSWGITFLVSQHFRLCCWRNWWQFSKMEVKFIQHRINSFIVNNSVAFKHVHSVVQPPPLSSSKTFSSPQRKTPYPLSNHSRFPAPPSRWHPEACFLSLWIYLFFVFHTKYTQYVTFRVWLLPLSLMFSRFTL